LPERIFDRLHARILGEDFVATLKSRPIPSLDGLRAVSVAIVILAHALAYLPGRARRFPAVELSWLGQSGVDVFFVISGFLITYLLLKENEATGRIGLKSFYFRRFFRIFPPFYVYLTVVGILWATGIARQNVRNFLSAATYTWNYQRHAAGYLLAHTWSLSLEEQFYLLWPPCLVLLGKKKSIYLSIGLIALSPVSRLITYLWVPWMRGGEAIMLHTRLDTIMCGCAMALLWDEPGFNRWIEKLLRPELFAFSVFYVLILAPCLSARLDARYDWTIGYTLRAFLISIALLYVVRKPFSLPGRLLNTGPIRHVGIISYSLYLWQQMFTGPYSFWVPLNLVAIFACAELSYWLIERPALRLRDRIGKHLSAAPTNLSAITKAATLEGRTNP
jgi:peptidoglycan/LPS O-acetylase OafA/YrhL